MRQKGRLTQALGKQGPNGHNLPANRPWATAAPQVNDHLHGRSVCPWWRVAGAALGGGIAGADRLGLDRGFGSEADVADLRALLYGLHAILRLHTAQEDESYLSLAEGRAGNAAARRPAGSLT